MMDEKPNTCVTSIVIIQLTTISLLALHKRQILGQMVNLIYIQVDVLN
jgi:hypothetical protein